MNAKQPSLAQMKRDLIEDYEDTARNDRGFLRSLIQDLISGYPDNEIPRMWLDAGLGESHSVEESLSPPQPE